MTPEKTIKLNGQEVSMIYCAATENGYEKASEQSISVFVPTLGKNDKGETIIEEPAKATIGDFLTLAFAGIVAAYARKQQQAPVTAEYILYDATPEERNDLIIGITELRTAWYEVPAVVKTDEQPANVDAEEQPKN